MDEDGSGDIDFDEFRVALYACDPVAGNTLGFAPNKMLTPADVFQMFDEDGSGTIDEDEFADCLEYMNIEISDSKLEKLFRRVDQDSSGAVDLEEFKACPIVAFPPLCSHTSAPHSSAPPQQR